MALTTAEKFLLLAQHPEKGRFLISGIHIKYSIPGALVLDMSLQKKVAIENDKLLVKSRKRTTDPIEAEVITTIQKFKKPRSVRRSISKLSGKSGTFKRILLAQMVRKRLIRREEKSFLGFIRYNRYYLVNRKLRNDIIKQLKENLLFQKELSNEDAVVLGLIEACKMHKVLSADKNELNNIKKQLKEKLKKNAVASSVDKIISQVQAAVMGAVVAAAVAGRR